MTSLAETREADPKASPSHDDDLRHDDHSIQEQGSRDLPVLGSQDLEVIGNFADQVGEADQEADRGSLDAGRALKRLYDSAAWIEEWLLKRPIKDRSRRGPKPKPDTQARFNGWLTWQLEQKDYKPLGIRRTNQLLLAARTVEKLGNRGSQISSERVIRPLNWLLGANQQYGDRAPEVWSIAVGLAGSADQVTEAHTRKALAQWRKNSRSSTAIKPEASDKSEHERCLAVQHVYDLYQLRDSPRGEKAWQRFDRWYQTLRETGEWGNP